MLFGGNAKDLRFNQKGLIPVIIQDAETDRVLLFIYMNQEAVKKTKRTKDLYLYHRSKKKVWKKGTHSGNTMKVEDVFVHHDRNVLLIKVIPNGPACHTGNETCFIHSYLHDSKLPDMPPDAIDTDDGLNALKKLFDSQELSAEVEIVSAARDESSEEPQTFTEAGEKAYSQDSDFLEQVYSSIQNKIAQKEVNSVSGKITELGAERIAQKIGENAMQLMISVTQNDQDGMVKKEAEMMHNMLILLAEKQLEITRLRTELNKRITM